MQVMFPVGKAITILAGASSESSMLLAAMRAAAWYMQHYSHRSMWLPAHTRSACPDLLDASCRNEKVPGKELTNLVTTLEAIPAPAPAPRISLPGGMQAAPVLAPALVPGEPTAHSSGNV